MPYEILVAEDSPTQAEHLARVLAQDPDCPARVRVAAAIELLSDEPRPPPAKKLTGRPEWRVRTGDYRVLYRIEDSVLTIVVVHAGHRREVYDR